MSRFQSRPADKLNLFSCSIETHSEPNTSRQKITADMRPAGASLELIHAPSQLSATKQKREKSDKELNLFSTDKPKIEQKKNVRPIGGISSLKTTDDPSHLMDSKLLSRSIRSTTDLFGSSSAPPTSRSGLAIVPQRHVNEESKPPPEKKFGEYAATKNKSKLAFAENGIEANVQKGNLFHRAGVKDKNMSKVFTQEEEPMRRTKAFVPQPVHQQKEKVSSFANLKPEKLYESSIKFDENADVTNVPAQKAKAYEKSNSSRIFSGEEQPISRKARVDPSFANREPLLPRPSVKVFERKDSGRLW